MLASSGWGKVLRVASPILAVTFCADVAFILVYLIALEAFLPASLHTSEAIAGIALSVFGLSKLLSQFAGGMLTDRLGVGGATVAGAALILTAYALMLPLGHIQAWAIVGLAFLDGLGSSIIWPALFTAGSARFESTERARFTAAMTLMSAAAVITAFAVGVALNSAASFDLAISVPILLIGFGLILAFSCNLGSPAEKPVGKQIPVSLRQVGVLIAAPRRLAFAVLQLAEAAALGGMTAVFAAYGRDLLQVSLTTEELLLIPAALLGAACLVLGGTVGDRLGPRKLLVPSFLSVGVCLLLLSSLTSPASVALLATVASIAFGLGAPSIGSAMLRLAGSGGAQGSLIGWFMTAESVGRIVGPGGAGIVLSLLGMRAMMLTLGALFLLVSGLGLAVPDEPAPIQVLFTE